MGACFNKGKIGPEENATDSLSVLRTSHLIFTTELPIWYQNSPEVLLSVNSLVSGNLSKWRSLKQRFINPNEIVYFFQCFVQISPYIDGLILLDPCYSLASYDRVSIAIILKAPSNSEVNANTNNNDNDNLKKSSKNLNIENNQNIESDSNEQNWSNVKQLMFDDILKFISDLLIHHFVLNGKLYLYVSPTPDLPDEFAVPQIIRVEVSVLRNVHEFNSVSMLMNNTLITESHDGGDEMSRTTPLSDFSGFVSLWDTFSIPSNSSVLIDKNSNIKRGVETINNNVEKKEKTLEREIMYLAKKFILTLESASADHGRGDRIRYLYWLTQSFECIVSLDCLLDSNVEASHVPLSLPLQAYRRLYPNRINGYPALEPRGDLKGASEKKRSYLVKFMDLMDEAGDILGFSDIEDYESDKSDEKKEKEKEKESLEFGSAVDVEEGAELIDELQTQNSTIKKRNDFERSEEDNIKSKQWWIEMNSAVRLLDLVIQRDHYENLRDCSSCSVTFDDINPINEVEMFPPRGGVVRPNMLFRAASLHSYPIQELQKLFTHFSIQTVIDLRTEKDIRTKPYIEGLFNVVISPFSVLSSSVPPSRKTRTFTSPSLVQSSLPLIPLQFPKDSGLIYINIPIVPYTTLRLPPQLQNQNHVAPSLPPLHSNVATRTFSSPNILPLQSITTELEQNENYIDQQATPDYIIPSNTNNSPQSPTNNNNNNTLNNNANNITNNNSNTNNNTPNSQTAPLIYGPQSGEPFDRNWAFYEIFPRYSKDEISLVFRTLGTAPWPVILHCSEGRDRTGCLVAMLLLLVGCTPDQVRLDYLSSGKFTQPHSILTTIKVIEEYGGIDQYLLNYIGVSVEHLSIIKERLDPKNVELVQNIENDLNTANEMKNIDSQPSPNKKWPSRKNSKPLHISPRNSR